MDKYDLKNGFSKKYNSIINIYYNIIITKQLLDYYCFHKIHYRLRARSLLLKITVRRSDYN